MGENTHREVPVLCVRHGHQSKMLLNDLQLEGREEVLCPKCSLQAVPMNFVCLLGVVPSLIKEIASLRSDVFDLQCNAEESDAMLAARAPDKGER